MKTVEISIIVPVLDERQQLPGLLADLVRQSDVVCELLICDGGSTDGSLEWLRLQQFGRLPINLLQTESGRGRQLNLAVEQATGEWLLFLHADSRFPDPQALRKGLDFLQGFPGNKVAGHFALQFRRDGSEPSLGYYYYENKARLGRSETVHGDQGFLLHRELRRQNGAFREDLPVMEDTDFAERLRRCAQWRLLPVEISTSARRFEQEGLWQRQLLNSIIMCLRSIGYTKFFQAAPEIYRQQQQGHKLKVRPFFTLIRRLFAEHSWRRRWQIWWCCGCYVRNHAWQLAYALDVRRAFRSNLPVGSVPPLLTDAFEPVYDLLTDNRFGRTLATFGLWLWFEIMLVWLKTRE